MPSTPQLHRTWGTRYDSLVDTPPSTSTMSSPEFVLHHESSMEKDRPVISGPVSIPATTENATQAHVQTRMPHDASVFVASLPAQIPEIELLALLTAHLAPHATIKHIKLIRDNRGAVCAFVQVESALQATALISACNLSLFMDRQIRCERARAFRTLIVSWRTPEDGIDKQPMPVRLRRCRGTRYIQVNFGHDAINFDGTGLANYSMPREDDPLSGAGIFFEEGVKEGDYKTLEALMHAFGPLEFINPCDHLVDINKPAFTTGSDYASFQNLTGAQDNSAIEVGCDGGTQKSPDHDESGNSDPIQTPNLLKKPRMYEVKWEHRNDAVSAVTALQSIPTLSVCWSHTHGTGRPHPNHLHNCESDGRNQSVYANERGYGIDRSFGNDGGRSFTAPGDRSFNGSNDKSCGGNGETSVGGQSDRSFNGSNNRPFTRYTNPSTEFTRRSPASVTFSESDFPPLGGHGVGIRGGRRRGAWGRKGFVQSSAPSPPLSLDTSPLPPTPSLDSPTGVDPSPITSGIPATPDTPGYGTRRPLNNQNESQKKEPGLDIPHVPQLPVGKKDSQVVGDENRFIYRDGNGTLQPQGEGTDGATTLKNADANVINSSSNDYMAHSPLGTITNNNPRPYNHHPYHNYPPRHQNHIQYHHPPQMDEDHLPVLDPRELFVGGLNNETWTEERVKDVFGAYGTIEDLRFVRPGYHASMHKKAFAFVRFTDVDGPQKAIQGQHLRVYDDHKIKVQLRDTNPPRRQQWVYRGRGGRFHQGFSPGHMYFEQQNEQPELEAGAEVYAAAAGKPEQPTARDEVNASAAKTVPAIEVSPEDIACNPASENIPSPMSETRSPDATLAGSPVNINITLASPLRRGNSIMDAAIYDAHSPVCTVRVLSTTDYADAAGGGSPPPGVELAPAPVRPTGYIQRDGIFIPVYPPERLGQYMSTTDQTSTSSQQVAPTNWSNIPPHPQLYPVPYSMMMSQGQQHQTALQHQNQQPNPNGWVTSPSSGLGVVYPPSTAPPPYPAPNAYYPSQQNLASSRPSGYAAPYENTGALQGQGKNGVGNRRGGDYSSAQRMPREGRRRGTGSGEQSYSGGEAPWMKATAGPIQTAAASGTSQWN
ncbi:hypothetical protein BU17DRAFT_67340 [Hysterangium stoloniferum]|nr:hypothetical protein BU17DRAFT_67340 [Hysterangium stoloniferum]